MATVDSIRKELIDKILNIHNMDFLVALDKLVSYSHAVDPADELSPEQKELLEMSEVDIKNGKMMSQQAMDKRNLEWLNEL
jgi:hypothetical protein